MTWGACCAHLRDRVFSLCLGVHVRVSQVQGQDPPGGCRPPHRVGCGQGLCNQVGESGEAVSWPFGRLRGLAGCLVPAWPPFPGDACESQTWPCRGWWQWGLKCLASGWVLWGGQLWPLLPQEPESAGRRESWESPRVQIAGRAGRARPGVVAQGSCCCDAWSRLLVSPPLEGGGGRTGRDAEQLAWPCHIPVDTACSRASQSPGSGLACGLPRIRLAGGETGAQPSGRCPQLPSTSGWWEAVRGILRPPCPVVRWPPAPLPQVLCLGRLWGGRLGRGDQQGAAERQGWSHWHPPLWQP